MPQTPRPRFDTALQDALFADLSASAEAMDVLRRDFTPRGASLELRLTVNATAIPPGQIGLGHTHNNAAPDVGLDVAMQGLLEQDKTLTRHAALRKRQTYHRAARHLQAALQTLAAHLPDHIHPDLTQLSLEHGIPSKKHYRGLLTLCGLGITPKAQTIPGVVRALSGSVKALKAAGFPPQEPSASWRHFQIGNARICAPDPERALALYLALRSPAHLRPGTTPAPRDLPAIREFLDPVATHRSLRMRQTST